MRLLLFTAFFVLSVFGCVLQAGEAETQKITLENVDKTVVFYFYIDPTKEQEVIELVPGRSKEIRWQERNTGCPNVFFDVQTEDYSLFACFFARKELKQDKHYVLNFSHESKRLEIRNSADGLGFAVQAVESYQELDEDEVDGGQEESEIVLESSVLQEELSMTGK
ncbi:hypothetical protein K2W90_01505 [Candidatus Babeliales bacterium]|nr:hypothetical protein [Candidatus Babeliales bacterium]